MKNVEKTITGNVDPDILDYTVGEDPVLDRAQHRAHRVRARGALASRNRRYQLFQESRNQTMAEDVLARHKADGCVRKAHGKQQRIIFRQY